MVADATHLFQEPETLQRVADDALDWIRVH